MAANPQSFFSFAARHYLLLHDLFRREGGFGDAELHELILRNRAEGDPAPVYVAEQLQKLGIIEPTPGATAVYEMTMPVRMLMRYLLREQRLTSTAVIQAYIDDLERSRGDLERAVGEGKPVWIERALNEIGETLERVRQDSRANHEAVINEVMAVKSNRERRSVRERFENILYLWSRYLEPLQDLIDVRKTMDGTLDGLERLLKSGGERFELDGALHRELVRCRARLQRLRRDMVSDFHESLREVQPLFESLKYDSELVQGASRILEKLGREGLRGIGPSAVPFISGGRLQEGLLDDTEMESYLHGVKGYRPRQAPSLSLPAEAGEPRFIDPDDLHDRLEASLPLADVLGWLLAQYGDLPLGEVLRAYGRIYGDEWECRFAEEEKTYTQGNTAIIAHPMQVGGTL